MLQKKYMEVWKGDMNRIAKGDKSCILLYEKNVKIQYVVRGKNEADHGKIKN